MHSARWIDQSPHVRTILKSPLHHILNLFLAYSEACIGELEDCVDQLENCFGTDNSKLTFHWNLRADEEPIYCNITSRCVSVGALVSAIPYGAPDEGVESAEEEDEVADDSEMYDSTVFETMKLHQNPSNILIGRPDDIKFGSSSSKRKRTEERKEEYIEPGSFVAVKVQPTDFLPFYVGMVRSTFIATDARGIPEDLQDDFRTAPSNRFLEVQWFQPERQHWRRSTQRDTAYNNRLYQSVRFCQSKQKQTMHISIIPEDSVMLNIPKLKGGIYNNLKILQSGLIPVRPYNKLRKLTGINLPRPVTMHRMEI